MNIIQRFITYTATTDTFRRFLMFGGVTAWENLLLSINCKRINLFWRCILKLFY